MFWGPLRHSRLGGGGEAAIPHFHDFTLGMSFLRGFITMMTFKRLSNKQIEVVDTGEHFEFKEIKQ